MCQLWKHCKVPLWLEDSNLKAEVPGSLLYIYEAYPIQTADVYYLSEFDRLSLRSSSLVWWQQRIIDVKVLG